MIPPNQSFDRVLATKNISDIHSASDQTYVFPLWIYEKGKIGSSGTIEFERQPNLQLSVARKIAECVGRDYYPIAEYETILPDKRLIPEDIFDYIYAVLYSPSYREKYKEFLKIDFPCVPYPKDRKQFEALVSLGKELRELHLLESPKVRKFITSYPKVAQILLRKLLTRTAEYTSTLINISVTYRKSLGISTLVAISPRRNGSKTVRVVLSPTMISSIISK